jgi:hypothetical protein
MQPNACAPNEHASRRRGTGPGRGSIGVQFFHKPAVVDLFQKIAIDEIARFQILRNRALFGATIENRLNTRRGRSRNCRNPPLAPIISAEGRLTRLRSATTLAVVALGLSGKKTGDDVKRAGCLAQRALLP